jgi:hypothetical protein
MHYDLQVRPPSEFFDHTVKKILVTERLCEELYRTALHRLHGHWHVGVGCDEDNRHLPVCGGELALKLKTASSQHSHVEYQASRAVRRICLQELGGQKKRACRPTVRNSRATESRNSGSSSMTETLGFALPIPGILRKESAFFHWNDAILRTICRDEQYQLPKRVALRPKPSLRGAGIALLGNVTDTTTCMQRYAPPVWRSEKGAWKPQC